MADFETLCPTTMKNKKFLLKIPDIYTRGYAPTGLFLGRFVVVGRLESTTPTFLTLDLRRKIVGGVNVFLLAISFRRVVVPTPIIIVNLPRTSERLHC